MTFEIPDVPEFFRNAFATKDTFLAFAVSELHPVVIRRDRLRRAYVALENFAPGRTPKERAHLRHVRASFVQLETRGYLWPSGVALRLSWGLPEEWRSIPSRAHSGAIRLWSDRSLHTLKSFSTRTIALVPWANTTLDRRYLCPSPKKNASLF